MTRPAAIMGFDFRYPHLHRLEHAPGLSQNEKRVAMRIAKRLHDNTGLRSCYNSNTGDIFCHYDVEPHAGPFAIPFKNLDDGSTWNYTDTEIGDYIVMAKYGQLSRDEKNLIAERNAKEEQYQNEKKQEAFKAERRPCVNDYAAHLDQKRRGVQKVISV